MVLSEGKVFSVRATMTNAPVGTFVSWLGTPGKGCLHTLLTQELKENSFKIFPIMEKGICLKP